MKKVLFLSYYFPPDGNVVSQIAAKFFKYLPRWGWQPVLLTKQFIYRGTRDYSYERDIPKNAKKFKALNFEPTSWLPWRLKALLDERFAVPDDKILWLPFATKEALQAIKKEHVNAIFAMAPPWTDLLIGQKLKQLTGIPLVIWLGDPWIDNPYRLYHHQSRYEREVQLEMGVFQSADYIVLAEFFLESLIQRYPFTKDKASVIPHGYDAEDFLLAAASLPQISDRIGDKLFIVYTGSFYGKHSPFPFIAALSELLHEHSDIKEKLEARFVGNMTKKILHEIRQDSRLYSVLKYDGVVPHSVSVQRLLEADVLLLVIHQVQKYALTTKLAEYLGSGKPILAIVPLDGVAAKLVRQTNSGIVVAPEDIQAIKQAILHFYELWQKKSLQPAVNQAIVQQFEINLLTQRLAKVLDQVAP
ncbi:MAG: glycosyltransferase [Candidatus Bathyarchaeia archaeon]